jgi:uncharacterized protein
MDLAEDSKRNLYRAVLGLVVVLSLFVAMKFLSELRAYGRVQSSEVNTISVAGRGEVKASPDIATIFFTIREEGSTVKEAQGKVANKEKQALEYLRKNSIEEKDIKTQNISFFPKYEYVYDTKVLLPCSEFSCPPRPGRNVITGYEASESLTLKVRNLDSAGEIVGGLGALGVTELSGPNFTVDDEEGLKREARKKAIEDAKEEARILARDLGVRLGRVASFSESGGFPGPVFSKALMSAERDGASLAAELPAGEHTLVSEITITYEIR